MTLDTSTTSLADDLRLPSGALLPNRIAKAAMSEQLGDVRTGAPSDALVRLYERWGRGGAGLLVTGNVMVDGNALGEPRNVVVEDDRHAGALRRWAVAAKAGGATTIVQLNHPGRQSPRGLSRDTVAPSAVPVAIKGPFVKPRALRGDEIEALIARFARTAREVVTAGFDGVQLHAAHGYLVSQFLSPHVNRRDDGWGGDPDRRRRFLVEVTRALREAIGADGVLSVKLNSADFQRGGFEEAESLAAIAALDELGVDLLEISGGTYERPAMTGTVEQAASTQAREAYFLEFAARAREVTSIPLMVTGGFRTGAGMADALASGATDVVGLARPLALEPDLPHALTRDPTATRSTFALQRIGIKTLDSAADLWWTQHQIERLGAGLEPDPAFGARRAALKAVLRDGRNTLRRRRG